MALSGCGTMYKMVELPDGTYKKVPIITASTFLLDFKVKEKDTAVLEDAEFTMLDGTKVKAANAIITTEREYETKGRGTDYAKAGGQIAQGLADSAAP